VRQLLCALLTLSLVGPLTATTLTTPEADAAAKASRVAPSGQRMPGRVKGWVRTYAEDFAVDQRRGTWPGRYAKRLYGYDCSQWGIKRGCDTSRRGDYDRRTVVSARKGVLDYYVHTKNGLPKVAAEGPIIKGRENKQKYGRYAVRWRVDRNLRGYKNAWLLWPASDRWKEGEIDFPEGNLDGRIEGYNHCIGKPHRNCYAFRSKARMSSGWHTTVIEWRPSSVKYYLDGRLVGKTTKSVPRHPMRWVLQTETNLEGRRIPASVSGHVQIDWIVMWKLA
jgi:hypothetical protein